ncbi:RTA-like protein [Lasiodiplodia theobromae]|uniref:RTA-like protein n=1 Tax=Lasiodiplodia theobromae TaxID=45133 RepID=UPI0015C2EC22|nr:RTA-like protein [Lasiodiplodia theobromae]KAF4543377.1 RTA-like protein [Lasiodiplodia theobromae]
MAFTDQDSVFYTSNWKCFAMLSSPLAQAMISLDCIEIAGLFIIAIWWLVSQRKIERKFRVVRWHNFGLAISLWLFYATFRFAVFLVLWCPFIDTAADDFKLAIAQAVFHWIPVSLLLSTVLGPICQGLDRLRNSPSETWNRATKLSMTLFTIFVIIYLAMMIVDVKNILKQREIESEDDAISRFWYVELLKDLLRPKYIEVSKGLETTWLILALGGITKMLFAVSHCSQASSSLKAWIFALAFSLFGYGVVRTFLAFWDGSEIIFLFYSNAYLAKYTPILVFPVFFSLLALLSVLQVATRLGMLLAADASLYEADPKPEQTAESKNEDSSV